jgi:caffeoyl-CoA O-methyltransferase
MKGNPITESLYEYILADFVEEDEFMRALPAAAEKRGIPLIHIAPEQGKFLQLMMKMIGARRVLEVGSLFGYSTIWMARALPAGGRLTAVELNPLHAAATRENAAAAGLAGCIDVREGDGRVVLPQLAAEEPFDMAFIDADKAGYVDYVDQALRLVRKGGLIIGDNASAEGAVWNPNAGEYARTIRAYNDRVARDPRLFSLLIPIADGMLVSVVM